MLTSTHQMTRALGAVIQAPHDAKGGFVWPVVLWFASRLCSNRHKTDSASSYTRDRAERVALFPRRAGVAGPVGSHFHKDDEAAILHIYRYTQLWANSKAIEIGV